MRQIGYVVGSPIKHSRSPAIHLAAYRELGLDWGYEAIEVTEGSLEAFVNGLPATSTPVVSVTMPLKLEAAAFADRRGPLVQTTGIANTLIFRNGGWFAENTDVSGITRTLEDHQFDVSSKTSITLLGSGATAISSLAALSQLGVSAITLVGRNKDALAQLVKNGKELSLKVMPIELNDSALIEGSEIKAALESDLVISTLPSEAGLALAQVLPSEVGFLFDVTYSPWPSELATAWFTNGGDVVGGLDLLVNQAIGQVEMATDHPAPIAAMRKAAGLPR